MDLILPGGVPSTPDSDPLDDDPMVGLDPWTAGYIRMRQFTESGDHTEEEVNQLAEAIKATLPWPEPPLEIGLVIQADLSLVKAGAAETPLVAHVQRIWTPTLAIERGTGNAAFS